MSLIKKFETVAGIFVNFDFTREDNHYRDLTVQLAFEKFVKEDIRRFNGLFVCNELENGEFNISQQAKDYMEECYGFAPQNYDHNDLVLAETYFDKGSEFVSGDNCRLMCYDISSEVIVTTYDGDCSYDSNLYNGKQYPLLENYGIEH